MKIRIISRPIGEAPEWVRDAWTGVELDALNDQPTPMQTFGIFDTDTSWFGYIRYMLERKAVTLSGFMVPSAAAIDVLSIKSPEAAKWWHENCPEYLEEDMQFVFDAPSCEAMA